MLWTPHQSTNHILTWRCRIQVFVQGELRSRCPTVPRSAGQVRSHSRAIMITSEAFDLCPSEPKRGRAPAPPLPSPTESSIESSRRRASSSQKLHRRRHNTRHVNTQIMAQRTAAASAWRAESTERPCHESRLVAATPESKIAGVFWGAPRSGSAPPPRRPPPALHHLVACSRPYVVAPLPASLACRSRPSRRTSSKVFEGS